jgi:hypothetical protein
VALVNARFCGVDQQQALALIAFVVGGFWFKGARGKRAEPTSKEPSAGRHTFKVTGLDCAEEVTVLRREFLWSGERNISRLTY